MYQFRYSLNSAPTARNDGSGCVDHDLAIEASSDEGETWAAVPGRHKTVSVPASEIAAALVADGGNWSQLATYIEALTSSVENVPVYITGWDQASLQAMMTANDLAAEQAAALAARYPGWGITEYPLKFVWS